MTLFDPGPPIPSPPRPSRDARRTLRNWQLLEGGTHPITRLKVQPLELGRRCGNCQHLVRQSGVAGNYLKCGAQNGRYITGGPATDLRRKWPACVLWNEVDDAAAD